MAPKQQFFSGEKLFQLYDTHGLPLEVSIEKILDSKILINWRQFILTAAKAGWGNKKIYNTIFYALDDVTGYQEYKDGLKIIITKLLK